MTVSSAIRSVANALAEQGIDTAFLDAQVLVRHVLGISSASLLAANGDSFSDVSYQAIQPLVARRINREPLAYILGEKEFFSLPFHVNSSVLIPRPETEMLVEYVLDHAPSEALVHDLCCGSGAVGISIKDNRQDLHVTASDLSSDAVITARHNSTRLVGGAVTVTCGDLFADLVAPFDVIVTNPPYVPPLDRDSVEPELHYEPDMALYCSDHGLEIPRKIIQALPHFLKSDGFMVMEIDFRAGSQIVEIAQKVGFRCTIKCDLAGKERMALITNRSELL